MPITTGKGERRRVIHKRRLLDELRPRARRSEHLVRWQQRMVVETDDDGVGTMTGGGGPAIGLHVLTKGVGRTEASTLAVRLSCS